MRRRQFLSLLGGAAAMPLAARAQQQAKLSRIGFLRVGPPPPAWIAALRQGLREHGLIEGQHIEIEFGLAQSVAELPSVAAELVRRKVDVLFASGSPTVLPARDAADGTTPVVFVGIFDFVETREVASLARPGGNLTGMSGMVVDLAGKRMQLLKELLPRMTRVAILVRADSPATPPFVREAERSAQVLGVELQVLSMGNPGDLEMLVASASNAGGLIGSDDAVFTAHRQRIAELALKQRLPTMFGFREMVEAGCLISYGPNYADLYQRAASHVHKILNGTKPADLPVGQPVRFESILNMRTAKALGLTIPTSLLARADEVIE
jgi:putative ABC transport system substrate-binding protein